MTPSPAATRWRRLSSTTWGAAAPGLLIAFVLWVIAFVRIDFASYTQDQIDNLWQSLGSPALASDPLGSLAVLHIQPPGLNALYALDLALTPGRHLLLAAVLLAGLLGSVLLIVDTLRRVDVPGTWALWAGVGYALLPGTVIYALWAYSTSPLAFLTVAAVWAVALMRTRPALGASLSASAALFLVLTRPSFAWFALVAWGVALVVLLIRRRQQVLVGSVIVVAAVVVGLGVQVHYLVSFGLPTMTSWTGENLAKALATSRALTVTPAAEAALREDPCLSQMLDAYRADALNRWDDAAFRGLPACAEIPGLAPTGHEAWDSPTKGDTGIPNLNYADRLVASREWTRMMTTIVARDPLQLARMALTTQYGPNGSGLSLYLGPSEDYPFVTSVRDALPTSVPLGVLSIVYAPALWVLVVVGVVHAIVSRRSRLRRSAPFWFGFGLLAYHLLTSTLLEYSENMRFRAEADALLLVIGVMALFDLVRREPQE